MGKSSLGGGDTNVKEGKGNRSNKGGEEKGDKSKAKGGTRGNRIKTTKAREMEKGNAISPRRRTVKTR